MSIRSEAELEGMRAVGRVVALALAAMKRATGAGITTGELAAIGGVVMRAHGARSAPALAYGFPGDVLISLNDEAVHGIPSRHRAVCAGDVVKLDVTFEKNGFMADAAATVAVPPVTPDARRLIACAERAFRRGLRHARAGARVRDIGRAIEREVAHSGFAVIRELGGHGIGRAIHEPPSVPNYDDPAAHQLLTAGMVVTIEPIIAAGSGRAAVADDGWTVTTSDGALAAHYEHTLVITDAAPILLTA